jgi:SAM-dependent methyltransferase
MHPEIRRAIAGIIAGLPAPRRVIEIGQDRDHPSLIELPELSSAPDRVAVGLSAGGDHPGITYICCNAHDLSFLPSASFDLLLSNAMLEHDRYFWRSLAEMRRLTRSGGHVVIGVPGFGAMSGHKRGWRGLVERWVTGRSRDETAAASPTLGFHGFPDDYYRFSESAMEEVLLEGFRDRRVFQLLYPPRLIGLGRREGPTGE